MLTLAQLPVSMPSPSSSRLWSEPTAADILRFDLGLFLFFFAAALFADMPSMEEVPPKLSSAAPRARTNVDKLVELALLRTPLRIS